MAGWKRLLKASTKSNRVGEVKVSVYLPKDIVEKIDEERMERGLKRSTFIREMIVKYYRGKEK